MSRIFISYKRVDKEKVFKIKDQIESALGEKCWIDIEGIESDAQFKSVIIDAINECEVLLFMYSKAHLEITDFENDWTVRELNFAKKKRKRIVLVNIDGTEFSDNFEFDYGLKQQIFAQEANAIKKLIQDIIIWLNISEIPVEIPLPQNNDQGVYNISETQDSAINSSVEVSPACSFPTSKTPVVILYGAEGVGKSSLLVSVCRLLLNNGYDVAPNKNLFGDDYVEYQQGCNDFNPLIPWYSPSKTVPIMVDVFKKGERLFHILDTPGSLLDIKKDSTLPYFINYLIHCANPKVFLVMLEPYGNIDIRNLYSQRIRHLSNLMTPADRMILLLSKIDNTRFESEPGVVNIESIKNEINSLYNGVLDELSGTHNRGFFSRFFAKSNRISFLPYSSAYTDEILATEDSKAKTRARYTLSLTDKLLELYFS